MNSALIKNKIMKIKPEHLEQLEKELQHIFDTGANEVRVYNMIQTFIERRGIALFIPIVSNSTALEQLFSKCKQDDPTMTKEEFNEALDLLLYRLEKDQQIKQMRSEQ